MLTGFAAFLDVLGFSSLVAGEDHSQRIDHYLDRLNAILDNEKSQIEYVVFSDSIILTTHDDSMSSFLALANRCSFLFGSLLQNQIAVRGALAHGSFIRAKTNSGIFVAGRAVIEAYQFEKIQDWVGIMLAPSIIRHFPALRRNCEWVVGHHQSDDLEAIYIRRLPLAAFVQCCDDIPFHENQSNYQGLAIVPSSGTTQLRDLLDSLDLSLEHLNRLKFIAPDPAAQAKYDRSLRWLRPIRNTLRQLVQSEEDYRAAHPKDQ